MAGFYLTALCSKNSQIAGINVAGITALWWGIASVCGRCVIIDGHYVAEGVTMVWCEREMLPIGARPGGKHAHVNVTHCGGSVLVWVQEWAGAQLNDRAAVAVRDDPIRRGCRSWCLRLLRVRLFG